MAHFKNKKIKQIILTSSKPAKGGETQSIICLTEEKKKVML